MAGEDSLHRAAACLMGHCCYFYAVRMRVSIRVDRERIERDNFTGRDRLLSDDLRFFPDLL